MKPPPQLPKLVIDTAEQRAFSFQGITADARDGGGILPIESTCDSLVWGDYSVQRLEHLVAVERKSLADLYGTIGQERERFERELSGLNVYRVAAVVVEADWSTILNTPPEHSQLPPRIVYRSVLAWQQRYPRVHWWMCPDRRFAEITTWRILYRAWKTLTGDPGELAEEEKELIQAARDFIRNYDFAKTQRLATDRKAATSEALAWGLVLAQGVLRDAGVVVDEVVDDLDIDS